MTINRKHKLRAGHLSRSFRKLKRNQDGSPAIETAFVLPVLLFTIIGTFEMGTVMLSQTMMEGAISEASRAGMTGYVAEGKTREEYINDLLKERTFGMIEVDNLTIEEKVYSSFSDIDLPEPYNDLDLDGEYTFGEDTYLDMNCNDKWDNDIGTNGLGGPGDVVVYTVVYDSNFMTGFFSKKMGDEEGKIRMEASTAIRNEPYGASTVCDVEEKV